MSEQLANVYASTLSANYTAGSGTMHVTSAVGTGLGPLPVSGTFSLTIIDQITGKPKLIVTVSEVSGTTLTVAAETSDVNCNSGDGVVGTMYTTRSIEALINQLIAATPASFIQQLTAPVPASFSQDNFNNGLGVVTTQTNISTPVPAICINQHDPNATKNIAMIDKAVIASKSFTLTVALSVSPAAGTNDEVGLTLTDGGGNVIVFGLQNGTGGPATGVMLCAFTFTSFDTFGSVLLQAGVPSGIGPLLWLRIVEDATHRSYFTSSNGVVWKMVFQESVTAHFTTTKYGFGCGVQAASAVNADTQVTMYSFTETNP